MNERRWNLVISCGCAFVSMVAVGYIVATRWALLAMCLATIGFYGMKPVFWPLPSQFLSGTAAAGGIAVINSIGNLGGFFGPMLLGWVKETTGAIRPGFTCLPAARWSPRCWHSTFLAADAPHTPAALLE
jgi:ACS family tartrate transporter-like MFS transporter